MCVNLTQGQKCRLRAAATVLLALGVASCGSSVAPARPALAVGQYADLAKVVFDESNRLRSEPDKYAEILAQRQQSYSGKIYHRKNNPADLVTNEGVDALNEAVRVLQLQPVTPTLKWSESLAEVARAHVTDSGSTGMMGHDGSGSNTFANRVAALMSSGTLLALGENIAYGPADGREVVLQLVVDDGVASRGHRDNLLKAEYNVSGVGCGYHSKYTTMCVAIYGTAKD